METNDVDVETSSARVNIGIRVSPGLKDELNYEAFELGQTSSEYGESILHNRHKHKEEIEKLNGALAARDKTINDLNAKSVNEEKRAAEIANYQIEIETLKEQLAKAVGANDLFKDKRLQFLFEKVKGKKDKVENAFGDDFDIVYNSPEAVLIALIYSCELNK